MSPSNYPPSVTGLEPQITGGCEGAWIEERTCDSEVPFVHRYQIQTLLTAVKVRQMTGLHPEARLAGVLQDLQQFEKDVDPGVHYAVCGFQGEVEVTLVGRNGPESWTCPWCGTEHENEL